MVAAEPPGRVPALTQHQAAGGAHGRPEAVHLRVLLAVRLPHHLALQDLLAAGPQLLGHGCGGGGVGCAGTGTGAGTGPGTAGEAAESRGGGSAERTGGSERD